MKIRALIVAWSLFFLVSVAQALTVTDYEKWSDKSSSIAWWSQDCYSTEFSTGDLISTLIVGDYKTEYAFRSPKIYTSEYLMNLDTIIVHWLKKYWIKGVFAWYICNRGDWVDIIVDNRLNRLIIRNKNSILLLPKKVQTTITSPTGWWYTYCKPEKAWDILTWDCSIDSSTLEGWWNTILKYKINIKTAKYTVEKTSHLTQK